MVLKSEHTILLRISPGSMGMKMRTKPFLDMVKTVFIVDIGEKTARGIRKSPEQREGWG